MLYPSIAHDLCHFTGFIALPNLEEETEGEREEKGVREREWEGGGRGRVLVALLGSNAVSTIAAVIVTQPSFPHTVAFHLSPSSRQTPYSEVGATGCPAGLVAAALRHDSPRMIPPIDGDRW